MNEQRMARALGWFSIGLSGGAMLAYFAGGALGELLGWRLTFVTLGLAGIPISILVALTLRDARRRGSATGPDAAERTKPPPLFEMFRRPSYVLLIASLLFSMIPAYAVSAWAPAYFMRTRGLSIGEMGLWVGLINGIGHTLGAVGSGFLSDWAGKGGVGRGLLVPAIGTALAGPLFTLTFYAPGPVSALVLFALAIVLSSMWYAPTFAAIQTIASPHGRAQATAVALLFTTTIAGGFAPTVTGMLSDAFRPAHGDDSLKMALLIMANITILGGALSYAAGKVIFNEYSRSNRSID